MFYLNDSINIDDIEIGDKIAFIPIEETCDSKEID